MGGPRTRQEAAILVQTHGANGATSAARMAKHLLLIGAGHAHLEVLRRLGRSPIPGVRLTLITRDRCATYSGMLPGVIAGLYRREEAQVDAARLAAFAGARLHHDE